jgi:teichuronic acid biosynthesis glycosyltransferase TuaC
MLNLLVITTLFPNSIQHRHGIFIETRLNKILETGKACATVIAPVPWFPVKSYRFQQYSQYVDVPPVEQRNGTVIYHPRYLVIPKIGMLLTPFFLALSILMCIRKVKKSGYGFDLIDAHYFYPDGVAVALVAKFLKIPFVISARGSDINLITEFRWPREMILWAAKHAKASITVSTALKAKMVSIGADAEKIHVLRNGVDHTVFAPKDHQKMREKFGFGKTTLLSVGNLVELKGHDLIIKSLQYLPECELLIVGSGELEKSLKALADKLKVSDRVRFMGTLKQIELVDLYSAVDILVLASSREGWANVLLEAMSCGTPVAATNVGGTPEAVCAEAAGVLIQVRDPQGVVTAINIILKKQIKRYDTQCYAEGFSWELVIKNQIELYKGVLAQYA